MAGIKLSVCCVTYNHERYLPTALNSVLAQDVNFDFEIIIGDDFSTDGSRKIIEEYHNRYPEKIKPIFQPINSGGKKNFIDVRNAAKGEYIIMLETDDYWINNNKLQRQVEYLDSNPACIAVAHNCIIVDDNGNEISKDYPSIKSGLYKYKHFRSGLLPGQTTTIMYRNPLLHPEYDMSLYNSIIEGPGDLRKIFCLMSQGRIITLPEVMSAYRHIISHGNSFSANHKRDDCKTLAYFKEFQDYSINFSDIAMRDAADVRLFQTALGAYHSNSIDFNELVGYFKSCKHPIKATIISIYNIIKNKIYR